MQQLQPQRPPLRRATYIHVSDLTSAYNIDHKRLELELARVKVPGSSHYPPAAQPSETPTDEASVLSQPQKRLQPPRGGFNLCVLVGKVNVVVDKLRVDRSRVRLAEVEVGDETGTVSLRARDDQIDVLEEVSQQSGAVVLRNCTLELFQGKHIRLAVTKWGKMSVFPDDVASTPPPPSKMNRERNFSLIDLSIVASEMVENQTPEVGHAGSSRESPIRGPQSRQQFQAPQYPQQLQQRRTPRDRRQVRPGRGVVANPLAVPFPEMPMHNQMRYPGVPAYGYGESMEMQHYAYGIPRSSQESMQPSPHQYMQIQQQQYEMQRRQMQQMRAFHDQGDRARQMQRRMQPSRSSVPMVAGSNSFDSMPPEFPSLPAAVPIHGANRPREEGSSEPKQEESISSPTKPDMGAWRGHNIMHPGMDENMANSPRMNPTATAFSPSYGSPAGMQSMQGLQYGGYNPYEQSRSHYLHQQPAVYSQNIAYVPAPGGAPGHGAVVSDIAPDQPSEKSQSTGAPK